MYKILLMLKALIIHIILFLFSCFILFNPFKFKQIFLLIILNIYPNKTFITIDINIYFIANNIFVSIYSVMLYWNLFFIYKIIIIIKLDIHTDDK